MYANETIKPQMTSSCWDWSLVLIWSHPVSPLTGSPLVGRNDVQKYRVIINSLTLYLNRVNTPRVTI